MSAKRTSIPLMAIMMSLNALSIDIMLPALPLIGADLQLENPNNAQLVISMFFLGMAIGQLFYGPISDNIGRKKAISMGFVVFILGTFISLFIQSQEGMFMGRVLQGIGLSANRIVCTAIIRDIYEGNQMARIMSFVMSIFILIPVLAPVFGQALLMIWHWRMIFWVLLVLTTISMMWFWIQQVETLDPENRLEFSFAKIKSAMNEIAKHKIARNFTLIQGLVFGMFLGYLSSIQQILQDVYGLGEQFALWFGVLALSIGVASIINAKLVLRFGMYKMVRVGLWVTSLVTVPFVAYLIFMSSSVPFAVFIMFMLLILFHSGILIGNLNALIMEPLGHIAGTAASVVGSVSTFMSIPIGMVIGQYYNQSILPLSIGFCLCCVLALFIFLKTGTTVKQHKV